MIDPHIFGMVSLTRRDNVEYIDPGQTITARFGAREPEPRCPDGFEVLFTTFGSQITVHYRVRWPVESVADLFYPGFLFDDYRDSLAAFYAYRNQLVERYR